MKKQTQLVKVLKNNAPTILTLLSIAGVVTTTIMAVKATPKALYILEEAEQEKGEQLTPLEVVKEVAPVYIPTVLIGVSTIACIAGSNVLNKKQQASLASAYALIDNSYKEYRKKLIELYGKEADENVREAIVREHYNFHQINVDIPDKKVIFYEPYSGEYFERYEREIMDAEYHMNRNYIMRGYAPLNEFFEFLGLPQTPYGDELGWTYTDGVVWIDFEHELKTKRDGTTYYEINYVFPPDDEYLEEW